MVWSNLKLHSVRKLTKSSILPTNINTDSKIHFITGTGGTDLDFYLNVLGSNNTEETSSRNYDVMMCSVPCKRMLR
jgi:hypothetical protein